MRTACAVCSTEWRGRQVRWCGRCGAALRVTPAAGQVGGRLGLLLRPGDAAGAGSVAAERAWRVPRLAGIGGVAGSLLLLVAVGPQLTDAGLASRGTVDDAVAGAAASDDVELGAPGGFAPGSGSGESADSSSDVEVAGEGDDGGETDAEATAADDPVDLIRAQCVMEVECFAWRRSMDSLAPPRPGVVVGDLLILAEYVPEEEPDTDGPVTDGPDADSDDAADADTDGPVTDELTGADSDGHDPDDPDDPGDPDGPRADHLVVAVELDTGRQRWQAALTLRSDTTGDRTALPQAAGPLVLALTAEGDLVALATDDGAERWRVAVPGGRMLLGAAVAEREGLLLVTLGTPGPVPTSQSVLALELDTGEERWSVSASRVALGHEGAVAVDAGGAARGLNLADGTPRWEAAVGRTPTLALLIGPTVLLGDRGGVVALDLDDGAEIAAWPGPGTPAVWRDARYDVVLLLLADGLAYLDADGRFWQAGLASSCCRGAQVDDRTVLVALHDGTLVGLDRADGAEQGRIDPPWPDTGGAPGGAAGGEQSGPDSDHAFASGHRFLLPARQPISVHELRSGVEVARLPGSSVPLVAGDLVVAAVDGEVVALRGRSASSLLEGWR